MKKKISFGMIMLQVLMMVSGCGMAEPAIADPEKSIELVEPIDAAVDKFETVYRRNLYEANVYEANVYPYVEEYCFEDKTYRFASYGAYPGDTVKKGQVLMCTNAEELDAEIASMEERLRKLTAEYEDYCAKAAEKKSTLEGEMDVAGSVVENLSALINAGNTGVMADYETWTGIHNKAELDLDILAVELDKKTALYGLDYEYYNSQLQDLLAEKTASNLYSEMDGQIVGIQKLYWNQKLTIGEPLVAVADMTRKYIKCQYIEPRLLKTAYEVYALVGGKRYEVTYRQTEDEKCSSFVLHDEQDETDIGDYAVLVYMKNGAVNALTLSNEAIHQDVNKKYVHILSDGKVTTKEIQTGFTDGMFTEIISGLEEGDRVVVGDVPAAGENTAVLARADNTTMYAYLAEMYYPIYDYVRNTNTYVTTYFGEYLVPIYKDVKKGDPIARITVEADIRDLEEKETELRREKERLADYMEENKEEIETNEAVANKIAAWQETVADLEEVVETMRKEYTSTVLVAPIDGKVESLFVNEEYDEMYSGRACGEIVDTSVGFLVADSRGFINYGTELQVSYTTIDDTGATCTGTVITLGEYGVSESLAADGVLIKLPDGVVDNLKTHTMLSVSGHYVNNKITLKGVGKVMEDVVQIPADAVTNIDGKTYVNVLLKDGTVKIVPFLAGGHSREFYWVVDGLEAGMTVCW